MNRDVGETGHFILCGTIPVFSWGGDWRKTRKNSAKTATFLVVNGGSELNTQFSYILHCTMRSFMICTPHQISSEWPNQEEQDRRGMRHVWKREEKRIQGFGGNPEKKPRGRSRRRSDDNSKMCLQQISWDDVDWIDQTQDKENWRALVNGVSSFIKCWIWLYSMGLSSQL